MVVERSTRPCLLCGQRFTGRAFLCRACAARYAAVPPTTAVRQLFYERVDEVYPQWANTYGAYNAPLGLLAWLRQQPRSARVVELGAGGGFLLQELAAWGFRDLTAVDLARTALRAIHERVPVARVIGGDAERLPLATAAFDVVIACDLLEHLPDPAEHVREVVRVLRPGGYYLIKTPNRLLGEPYYRLAGLYDYPFWHPSLFTPGSLARLLRAWGFSCRFVPQPALTPAQLRKLPSPVLRALARHLPVRALPVWLRPHLEVVAQRR
ncbi:class I SAM-dependent methyltransferase [Thermorudis peleae]|uniref:class I SAM-dependent methyltransferase n=1 Tax=Thermorudis peleae TaxID=1382356 RepID=UPI000571A384|nr:class I SAM-dependent methyltransferase [Thermorudis peleae]